MEAAEADLFRGQAFVLTPLRRTSAEALALAQTLVEAVGARPMLLEAERHDRLVAVVSHLPYLVACGLVAAAEQLSEEDGALWRLAASGFRDTSRLAASDVTLMADILMTNREGVVRALRTYETQLHDLASFLISGDEEGLREALEASRDRRRSMFR